MFRRNRLFPLIFITKIILAQAVSTIDTINVSVGQQSIKIRPLVVDSTIFIFNNGRVIDNYTIDTINGEVSLLEPAKKDEIFIISYKYLFEPIPTKVGPLYLDLPTIDSLMIAQKIPAEQYTIPTGELYDTSTILATTGTVFRNISISPLGGSDFSGGLQLQLQGQLSDDITVSGVLSDQSTPIQPEGTTQTLDEIDKVYLHVTHPIFQLMAGDIDYSINSGKYLNVSRKLEGLHGQIKINGWSAQGALASSQGRYNKISFKGTDGSQGPYALTSETGNTDIIVLAGTEKVYLNGNLVKRGENFDYTIDYSTAEITFTPQFLIDFDTDIYIEYEYSDYQYSRNISSSTLEHKIGNWGRIGLAWLKEKDQFDVNEYLSQGILDSLEIVGDDVLQVSSIEQAEDGKYVFVSGKYLYAPDGDYAVKYNITFQNDNENGEYIRRISDGGEIYFEFINKEERTENIDLYSPYSTIKKPTNHEIYQIFGGFDIIRGLKSNWDFSFSNFDKNTYSNLNDVDNWGIAYNIEIDGSNLNIGKNFEIDYALTGWQRSKTFKEIGKERNTLFNREWNIQTETEGRESLLSGAINLKFNELINTAAEWSKYESVMGRKERFVTSLNGGLKYVPDYELFLNRVNSDNSEFYQYRIHSRFLSGNFHPIFSYIGEYEESSLSYNKSQIGFVYDKEKNVISATISQRKDHSPTNIDSSKMELVQEGLYGELEIKGNLNKYWSGKIIFKKRISDNYRTNESLNYEIGTFNIRYINRLSPFKWELLSKLEETFTESRAIVYDSVGVGLGSFRFDAEFNEYIADPNGDYISYTVLTGEKDLTSHISGSQRLYVDFGKTKIKQLQDIEFRSDIVIEYRGRSITAENIFSPSIVNNQISESKYNLRSEFDYNTANRRIRNWYIFSQYLNGADPRGSDLRNESNYNIEWREPLQKNMNSLLQIELHSIENSSNISELRNREVKGYWIEEQFKWNSDKSWQFSISANGGQDSGSHNNNKFDAYSYGIELVGQRFIKSTTSLKFMAEFYYTKNKNENSIIPPEALNGLPIGQSLSINFQGQILIGKNLSFNSTISFMDNSRYDNFFTLNGELRAYF